MARYDASWVRAAGYDRSYQPRAFGWGEGGRNFGPGAAGPYDRDFATDTAWGGDITSGSALYGPGRYGLGPYHERLRKRRRPDEELREEVEEALFYDTWVDAEAITVVVEDGVVTLRGELPSYEEVRYATDDAWDVDGVIGVRSELTVRAR